MKKVIFLSALLATSILPSSFAFTNQEILDGIKSLESSGKLKLQTNNPQELQVVIQSLNQLVTPKLSLEDKQRLSGMVFGGATDVAGQEMMHNPVLSEWIMGLPLAPAPRKNIFG